MTPILGGLMVLMALGGLVFAFKPAGPAKGATSPPPPPPPPPPGAPRAESGSATSGRVQDKAPLPSPDNDKEAKKRYMTASSVVEIHRLLSDAVDKRLASNRRKGLALRLEQAGSQMKPGEWLIMALATAVGLTVVATLVVNILAGLAMLPVAMLFHHRWLKRRVRKRQTHFGSQLGETLQLLAGSLRAGQSLVQALANVATDAPSPSAEEYRRILTENRLGRDLTEALYAAAVRMDSEDFEWVVGAIDINRTTGGDLAVILDRVTETIRERTRLRGQVRSLSAEGRLSGWVVGLLPPGVFCFVYMTNREYMATFFSKPLGYLLLGAAALLLFLGALWLKKIAKPAF
ncbi:MAG: type II secretion system F family protein [Acidimicrobiales bacterium]